MTSETMLGDCYQAVTNPLINLVFHLLKENLPEIIRAMRLLKQNLNLKIKISIKAILSNIIF